jgi:hypothetical protein
VSPLLYVHELPRSGRRNQAGGSAVLRPAGEGEVKQEAPPPKVKVEVDQEAPLPPEVKDEPPSPPTASP